MIGIIINTDKITNNIPPVTGNIGDPDNNSPPHNDLIEQIIEINNIIITYRYDGYNNLDKSINGLVVYNNSIEI